MFIHNLKKLQKIFKNIQKSIGSLAEDNTLRMSNALNSVNLNDLTLPNSPSKGALEHHNYGGSIQP